MGGKKRFSPANGGGGGGGGGEGGQQHGDTKCAQARNESHTPRGCLIYHPSHVYHHTHAHSMPRHAYFREHIFCPIPKVKRQKSICHVYSYVNTWQARGTLFLRQGLYSSCMEQLQAVRHMYDGRDIYAVTSWQVRFTA